MKKSFTQIALICAFLCASFSFAQQRECSTHKDLQLAMAQDPALEQNVQDVERFLKQKSRELISTNSVNGDVITIPVVVHVLYANATQNISVAQIQSQIDVLNEDFRRTNSDADNVWSQAADMQIEFCLAQVDPNGNATNGITRKASSVTSWNTTQNRMKSSTTGGTSPWDTTQYLNMWTVSALNSNGQAGILGYAQFPGGNRATDGVVMGYNYFGRTGAVSAPFNGGRTTTHEVGHLFGLRHIWGDGPCGADDFVSDTPESDASNGGCQVGTVSCGSVDMVQNYMDYSNDSCMNLFTVGQKARMRANLLSGGFHSALAQSTKCTPPSGGGATGCSSTIDNFPYSNGFENSLAGWTQDSGDTLDWTIQSGSTPSSSTGPSSADQGSYYVYVEASNPNFNKTAVLNSPCLDFSTGSTPSASFRYQMTGNAVGTLRLQSRASGSSSWSTVFTKSGDQGTSWLTGTAALSTNTAQVRLVVDTSDSWQGDIAVDAFEISVATSGGSSGCVSGVSSFPYNESFENTLGQWSQNNGDSHNWTLRSGGTPSSSTGPSGAAQGSFYVYVEASDPNFNKTAILDSPCFDLSNQSNATLSFQYQMTGNAVGTLKVQASTGGAYSTIFTQSGNQGAAWQTANVSLAAYSGNDLQLRLVVDTTSSWQGDIAVDNLQISGASADKCAGVPAYNSSNSYSVGDQVVYQNTLFERLASSWANLGTCGTAREAAASEVTIPLEITVYPNPVKGANLFTTAIGKQVSYVIYNLNGQEVSNGVVVERTINVANLKANIYLIQINNGNQVVTRKFVKK